MLGLMYWIVFGNGTPNMVSVCASAHQPPDRNYKQRGCVERWNEQHSPMFRLRPLRPGIDWHDRIAFMLVNNTNLIYVHHTWSIHLWSIQLWSMQLWSIHLCIMIYASMIYASMIYSSMIYASMIYASMIYHLWSMHQWSIHSSDPFVRPFVYVRPSMSVRPSVRPFGPIRPSDPFVNVRSSVRSVRRSFRSFVRSFVRSCPFSRFMSVRFMCWNPDSIIHFMTSWHASHVTFIRLSLPFQNVSSFIHRRRLMSRHPRQTMHVIPSFIGIQAFNSSIHSLHSFKGTFIELDSVSLRLSFVTHAKPESFITFIHWFISTSFIHSMITRRNIHSSALSHSDKQFTAT